MLKRVYVSPSTQEANRGVAPFTTEEVEMNLIADRLMPLLFRDGRFATARNTPDMTIYQAAAESNKFGADIHLAGHSNAGGGEGTEVFAYGPGTASERFAKCLYNHIAPLSPGKDRGVKYNKALVEVGDTVKATSALIELGFHDNAKDAAWMVNNRQAIAEALYKGICDFFGFSDYRALAAPVTPPPVEDKDIYLSVRVLESKSAMVIEQIRKMGYATKRLDLA